MDYTDSYYSRTLSEKVAFDPLDGDIDVDVVVIGGGLAGTATAMELAQRGLCVALLEAHKIGWGASGRNGGFATDNFPGGYYELAKHLGLERARSVHGVARRGLELIEQRIEKFSIDCGPVVRGTLRCNVSPKSDIRRQCEYLDENFGIQLEYWAKDRVRESLSTDRYHDAVLSKDAIAIHPLNLTCGMARACAESDVKVYESTPATRILSVGSGKLVETPNGRVSADKVVITCGGYIDGLNAFVSAGTVPLATVVCVTKPLGDTIEKAIRVPYAISDNTFAVNYYRRLPKNRLLWGGRIVPWIPGPAAIASKMKQDMAAFYPNLKDFDVETAWGGLMPFTRHQFPVVGQVDKNTWYLTGFGGLGVVLTNAFGELVAKAIAEKDDAWKIFAEFGLPNAGGKWGKAPAQLIYWGHKFLAAIGRPVLHE